MLIILQFANLDRKIIELYDDLMSQVSNPAASKGKNKTSSIILAVFVPWWFWRIFVLGANEKKTGKQDSLGKRNSNEDSLSEQVKYYILK